MSQQKPIARPVTEEAAAPIYVTTEDDFSGPHGSSPDPRFQLRLDFVEAMRGIPAVRGHWECPHCRMVFERRKPCCMHMGLVPDKPAQCRVLRAQDETRRGKIVEVELTPAEYEEAIMCGTRRFQRAQQFGRKGQNNQPKEKTLRDNQLGCLGERAYCKWKNLPLSAMDYYPDDLRAATGGVKPADFGDVDVKAKQKNGRYLLIQLEDPRHYVYVLASADIGDRFVTLCGWVHGEVAMTDEYKGDPCGTGRRCYGFPQEKLQPMSSLPC